jgi:hypothetical protein
MLLFSMSAAWAGPAVGVMVGGGVPLDRDVSDPGAQLGLYGGYRASVGPVHLQPEVILRSNLAAPAAALNVGGAVTFLGPISPGVYWHTGVGLIYDEVQPVMDFGALAEVHAVGPLAVGLRVGWQKDEPEPVASDDWLVLHLTVGLDL